MIFRRQNTLVEPVREPTPDEEWAGEVADVTKVDTDEAEIVERHLSEARRDHGDELETLAAAVTPIAEELEKPEGDIAAELAESSSLVRAYQEWQDKKGVSSWPAPDRRRLAEDAVRYLERRIARLNDRLRLPKNLTARQRERIEHELEKLEKEHDEYWGELNPALIGSVHGDGAVRADQLVSPPRHFCRTCDREIDRAQAYRVGHCDRCDREHQLTTGRPLPRV